MSCVSPRIVISVVIDETFDRVHPPLKWHMSYTSQAAIALGGHFLVPEIAHLTEMCRQVDNSTECRCTYDEHVALTSIVAYMMWFLPQLPADQGEQSLTRRSLSHHRR